MIFYTTDEQKEIAIQSRKALAESGRFDDPIVTKIEPAVTFYPAEDYHQDFYQKDPERYEDAHANRANFIKENW